MVTFWSGPVEEKKMPAFSAMFWANFLALNGSQSNFSCLFGRLLLGTSCLLKLIHPMRSNAGIDVNSQTRTSRACACAGSIQEQNNSTENCRPNISNRRPDEQHSSAICSCAAKILFYQDKSWGAEMSTCFLRLCKSVVRSCSYLLSKLLEDSSSR